MTTVVAGVSPLRTRPEVVAWAATEAWQRSATLELVTVGTTQPAGLAQQAIEHGPGLAVVTKIVAGPVEQALSDAAIGADLLVIGASSQSPFAEAITGSVPGALLTVAPCPVVVVPRNAEPAAGTAPIIVSVDSANTSLLVLEYAFAAAARSDHPLVALFCGSALGNRIDGVAERYPGVPVTELRVDNDPIPELTRRSERAALLVLGSRGRGSLTSLAFGSVSRTLIRSSHCPVAVLGPGLVVTDLAS